jgi:hypothetical protein
MAHVHNTHHSVYAREEGSDYGMSVLARVLGLIGFVIIALLSIRFVFVLFAANQANLFVNFVYTITAPLVSPFFGLFNYTPQFGIARFEFETLIAILFYALLFAILKRLATIGHHDRVDPV